MKSMLHVMEFLSSVGYKREEDKVIGMKISQAPGALCLLIPLQFNCYCVKCLQFHHKRTD